MDRIRLLRCIWIILQLSQTAYPALRGCVDYVKNARRVETCNKDQYCEQPDEKRFAVLKDGRSCDRGTGCWTHNKGSHNKTPQTLKQYSDRVFLIIVFDTGKRKSQHICRVIGSASILQRCHARHSRTHGKSREYQLFPIGSGLAGACKPGFTLFMPRYGPKVVDRVDNRRSAPAGGL